MSLLSLVRYQYTAHANDLVIPRQLPAVYFRYDFSSVSIKIAHTYAPFSDFLVEVCAIVGGMVTVMRLVHSLAKSMEARQQRKGGQGADGGLWGGAVPFRYDALTVQAPEPVVPNGYGTHAGTNVGGTPLLSPHNRALASPPSGGSPVGRQPSAPGTASATYAYGDANGNGYTGAPVHAPVHRQQVHGATAKPYDHDD